LCGHAISHSGRKSTARDEAKRLKREVDSGGDPVGAHQQTRGAPTMADLCARFAHDHLPRVRHSTQRDYRQQIAVDILPAIGTMKVAAASFTDIDSLHHRISKRAPIHANRVVALLSRMFSLAIRWGWRSDNPCRGIERNQEHQRHRYLSGAELVRLTKALAELRDLEAANAVRLLLLTGARRGELLAARWADIDLEAGIWTKPGATTKQKTLHRVPLSAPARQLLAEMRDKAADDAEWLFPAPRKNGHRTDIDDAWDALRIAAAIPDVRTHDLRHTYASTLVSSGRSLPINFRSLGRNRPKALSQ
jgi:integrase